jgi:hypothetical protein
VHNNQSGVAHDVDDMATKLTLSAERVKNRQVLVGQNGQCFMQNN